MRILATLLAFFLLGSLSAQTLKTGEASLFTMEESAQRVINLYNMDAAQANLYKAAVAKKVNSMEALDNKSLNQIEYAAEMKKIEAAYDNSMFSLLNEKQQKVYRYQQELMNTLVNKQNTPIPADRTISKERN